MRRRSLLPVHAIARWMTPNPKKPSPSLWINMIQRVVRIVPSASWFPSQLRGLESRRPLRSSLQRRQQILSWYNLMDPIWALAIIHKIDEFQIDVTVFYIGYNSSAVLDMSQIRKPTSRWDMADRLPEKDIKVGDESILLDSFLGRSEVSSDFPWRWKFLRYDHWEHCRWYGQHSLHQVQYLRHCSSRWFEVDDFPVTMICRIALKTAEDQPEDNLKILPTDDKKTVNMKKKKVGNGTFWNHRNRWNYWNHGNECFAISVMCRLC